MFFPGDVVARHVRCSFGFLEDAQRATSREDKARYFGSAVNEAVGIVEWFLSKVPKKGSQANKIRQLAETHLPRYRLLKRYRIHHFHRDPPPDLPLTPGIRYMGVQGPMRITSNGHGFACMSLTPNGPVFRSEGDVKIDRTPDGHTERELAFSNDGFFDEFKSDWVHIGPAVCEYLSGVDSFVTAVKQI